MKLNHIYCESNLDTMKRMPDGMIDLVVTSPPYDALRKYNGYSFPFEEIAQELFRVVKPGGVVVWVVCDQTVNGSETGTSFKQALYFKDCGFNLHDTMIYHKQSPPSIDIKLNRYYQHFEYMFIFSKDKPNCCHHLKINKIYTDNRTEKPGHRDKNGNVSMRPISNSDTKIKGNVWYYKIGLNNTSTDKTAFEHPAVFPEQLAADHIKSWSSEGDLVYDPFGGSGTTAKMAHLLNRKWIMSEISPDYCEIARRRLAHYLAQTNLFF